MKARKLSLGRSMRRLWIVLAVTGASAVGTVAGLLGALTRERWQKQREHFAAILTVQRQYEELTATHPDGHDSDPVVERGGVT